MKTSFESPLDVAYESVMNNERVNILGVGVSAINLTIAIETISEWIVNDEQHYVCVSGVHGIIECQRDEILRNIHNSAGLVTPDGMPLVWLSRLLGNNHVTRVYGPDLMLRLCEYSVNNAISHYFFGSSNYVLEQLVSNLIKHYPGIHIVGTYSPPFRPLSIEEDEHIIRKINESNPDIVWIGLSTPKQELWMAEHESKIRAPVMIGVGAAFDFHAGIKKQAPLWMQRNGFEWFFRLITEPRRLWRRYLINNPLFVILVLAQILGVKKYSLS